MSVRWAVLGVVVVASGCALSRAELERACLQGLTVRCDELAAQLEQIPVEQLEAECAAARPNSCTELGRRFASNLATKQDTRRAAELFSAACRQGDSEGCAALSSLAPGVAGMVRTAALRRAIERHTEEILECGRKAGVPLNMTVGMTAKLSPDGSVSNVSIVKDTAPSTGVAACVRARIATWQLRGLTTTEAEIQWSWHIDL